MLEVREKYGKFVNLKTWESCWYHVMMFLVGLRSRGSSSTRSPRGVGLRGRGQRGMLRGGRGRG